VTFAQRPLHAAPIVATLVLALAGCSSLEPDKIDYRSSGRGVPLEVPPDLTQLPGQSRYSVPATVTASGYQAGQAATAGATKTTVPNTIADVHYMRNGDERWLQVDRPPEKVWPLVRDFWLDNGFLIAVDNPTTGILETDWAENRAKIPMDALRKTIGKAFDSLYSTGERDRFRMRLEPTSGGTEIYISHRGMVEVYATADKDSTVWQPRPSDPELEAEFLRRLMLKLGADQERAKAQVASAAPGVAGAAAPSLVSLSASGDALDVRESFDRAWRRVGLALDRGGFTVEDRDRSQGVFFVRYIDPEIDAASTAKPGFFARMFSSSAKARANAQQFRVKVGAAGEQVRVTVLGKDGSQLATDVDRKTGTRILALLREQLQ